MDRKCREKARQGGSGRENLMGGTPGMAGIHNSVVNDDVTVDNNK
jgi:hypothetical protein